MEALVEAFKLCVHQVVDHALEDGQVAAAHVPAKEHSRSYVQLLAEAGDEGGGGKLGAGFYDGKMLLGDFQPLGKLALGEARQLAEFSHVLTQKERDVHQFFFTHAINYDGLCSDEEQVFRLYLLLIRLCSN